MSLSWIKQCLHQFLRDSLNFEQQVMLYPASKQAKWALALIFFVCLAAYGLTMPHTVVFEDSGLFSLVCYYAGIAHAPGYPLYSMLCPPFAHIPGLSPAHGVAYFSALCAAGAATALGWSILRLTGVPIAAIGAGLIFGLGQHMWSQAIIQEVYALNALLFFITLALCLELAYKQRTKTLIALALFVGLGLSNHWPLFVLSAIVFPMALLPAVKKICIWLWWRKLLLALVFFIAALLPYLYLWLRSLADPFISFYGPLDTWGRFWFTVARKGYSGIDNAGGNLADKHDFFNWLITASPEQLSWLWFPLIVIGIIMVLRKRILLGIGILLGMLGGTVLLILMLHFQYSLLWREVFRVYPLIAWGLLALLGGVGLAVIIQRFQNYNRKIAQIAGLVWTVLGAGSLAWHNGTVNAHPQNTFADFFATLVLDALPQDAILVTHDDTHLPILYKRYAEHYRPDVTIYNNQSLILGNRLTHGIFNSKKKPALYRDLVEKSNKEVWYFFANMGFSGEENHVILRRARRDWDKERSEYRVLPQLLDLVKRIDVFHAPSEWSRNLQIRTATWLATLYYALEENHPQKPSIRAVLESRPYGRIAQAYAWFEKRQPADELQYHINNLATLETQFIDQIPYNRASFYDYWGRALSVVATQDDYHNVERILLKGVDAYAANDSPPLRSLLELYAQTGRIQALNHWRKLYPNSVRNSDIIDNYDQYGKAMTTAQLKTSIENDHKRTYQHNYIKATQALSQNDTASAKQLIQALATSPVKPEPNHVLFIEAGVAVIERRYSDALELLKQQLSSDPNHIDSLLNGAKIALHLKQIVLAEQWVSHALSLSPDHKELNQIQAIIAKRKERQVAPQ